MSLLQGGEQRYMKAINNVIINLPIYTCSMGSEAVEIAKVGGIIAALIIIACDSRNLLSVKPVRKLFVSTSFFWAPERERERGRQTGTETE